MKNNISIGIDLGGTRIKGVAIDAEGNVLHQSNMLTNDAEGEIWKQAIKETVNDLKTKIQKDEVVVGISAPGLPNHENTAIANTCFKAAGHIGYICFAIAVNHHMTNMPCLVKRPLVRPFIYQ